MELAALLEKKKETILNEWFEQVIHTYAPDSASFYRNHRRTSSTPLSEYGPYRISRPPGPSDLFFC